MSGRAVAGMLALGMGCSAPAPLPALFRAEQHAAAGALEPALAAYREAQLDCLELRVPRLQHAACSEALLGEAELLSRAGRTREARAAYAAMPGRPGADEATAARALYQLGVLALLDGDAVAAWTAWWRVVTDHPDDPYASDAVRELVRDGRGRDPVALFEELARLLSPLATTGVADNLLWWMADLAEHELRDAALALALLDRISVDTPGSGLTDDATWQAARLALAAGDAAGAERRLLALLATRETAFLVGSYFSIWLDDAQLALGRLRRDHRGDLAGAERAFAGMASLYPDSRLRDDALWELAVTQAQHGDVAAACSTLAELRRLDDDSKFLGRELEGGRCD